MAGTGWQEGHPACKKLILMILGDSLPEKVEGPSGHWLTQVNLEKWPLNTGH